MKRLHVSSVNILFAVLCLVFTACNQGMTAGKGTGTVRIVIGGETTRAINAAGMPKLDNQNTKIKVTDENGTVLKDEDTTSATLQIAIGRKITVKAIVTTAAGVWRGSTEHTVTEGTNTIGVKISKVPKSVGNILFSVVSDNPTNPEITLKLGAKELLTNVKIGGNYIFPVTARDSIGRIYVLYDKGSTRRFTRFDAEGNEDTGFETAITSRLPPAGSPTSPAMTTMTVDPKTNTIFVVNRAKHVYAIKETGPNTFTHSNGYDLNGLSIGSADDITAVAAYNDALFLIASASHTNKLIACEVRLASSSLTLTKKDEKTLPKLRTDSAFSSQATDCAGLFADESSVCCLLKEQRLRHGEYALGQLVRYTYSGGALINETKLGLNPKANTPDSVLAFEAASFSNPIGFIGYDEDYIYIADDGVNIDKVNENLHLNGNKNRIAAFNRKTNEITFTDTEATWYAEHSGYQFPNTKILLWEKGDGSTYHGMQYWVADTANTPTPVTPADVLWFSDQSAVTPTDVFCYDQNGNLYILYKDGSTNKVRRFPLKEDGSYDTISVQNLNLNTPHTISAIAADISDGKNYLYYADTNSSLHTVKRRKWGHSSGHETFPTAEADTSYSITFSPDEKLTALAANKDGVFVATKAQTGLNNPPYTLKINKYKKNGSPDGEKTIANNEGGDYNSSGDYTKDDGTIYGLRVIDGELYALRHNIKEKMILGTTRHVSDEFRTSGVLYKVGQTANTFTGSYDKEFKKEFIDPPPSAPPGTKGTGYGFYRFIAVKPKKLVIASDGAWGKGGTNPGPGENQDTDTVLEYDLATHLASEPENAGGGFSKKLIKGVCDFEWQ